MLFEAAFDKKTLKRQFFVFFFCQNFEKLVFQSVFEFLFINGRMEFNFSTNTQALVPKCILKNCESVTNSSFSVDS